MVEKSVVKLGKGRRIVLPKSVLEGSGIREGDFLVVEVEKNKIVMRKV